MFAPTGDELLTYMSLRDEINSHVRASTPRLYDLGSLLGTGRASGRCMIVAPDIFAHVQPSAWPNNRKGMRLGRMRGALDRFTNNERISIALHPRNKPAKTYLARILPVTNEVWDIRSTEIKPGTRVLGRFAERDTFIALVWAYHEDVIGDRAWADFGQRCLDEWRRLFGTLPAFSGTAASDYLSGNYISI